MPHVRDGGQGGLLDVALSPTFAQDRLVYLSFSEPGEGGAGTAVARGRLGERGLEGTQTIWRQQPKVGASIHWGSRLVFRPDGTLFVTLGDRNSRDHVQNLATTIGDVDQSRRHDPARQRFVARRRTAGDMVTAIAPRRGARRARTVWTVEQRCAGGDE